MNDPDRERPEVPDGDTPTPDDLGFNEGVERTTLSPEGVDRTLILENLRRTPSEVPACL